jgi:hypothetical protein
VLIGAPCTILKTYPCKACLHCIEPCREYILRGKQQRWMAIILCSIR